MSHSDKKKFKILQASLQQYMNQELPDVQAGFRKAIGPQHQIATSVGSQKQHENSRKKKYLLLLSWTTLKPFTVWITKNLENS